MDASPAITDGRSLRHELNPSTVILAPPLQAIVSVCLDLGADKVTVDFDRVHVEGLHRELTAAMELIGAKVDCPTCETPADW
jgi:hypothetical protein